MRAGIQERPICASAFRLADVVRRACTASWRAADAGLTKQAGCRRRGTYRITVLVSSRPGDWASHTGAAVQGGRALQRRVWCCLATASHVGLCEDGGPVQRSGSGAADPVRVSEPVRRLTPCCACGICSAVHRIMQLCDGPKMLCWGRVWPHAGDGSTCDPATADDSRPVGTPHADHHRVAQAR